MVPSYSGSIYSGDAYMIRITYLKNVCKNRSFSSKMESFTLCLNLGVSIPQAPVACKLRRWCAAATVILLLLNSKVFGATPEVSFCSRTLFKNSLKWNFFAAGYDKLWFLPSCQFYFLHVESNCDSTPFILLLLIFKFSPFLMKAMQRFVQPRNLPPFSGHQNLFEFSISFVLLGWVKGVASRAQFCIPVAVTT